MMDGLLLVCLTGICAFPDPLLLYERLPFSTNRAVVEEAHATPVDSTAAPPIMKPTPVAAERPVASTATQAIIQAPAPIESDDASAPASGAVTSRATITEIVKGKSDGVRRCYEQALLDRADLQGTIEMGWKVDREGHVTSAGAVAPRAETAPLEACVRGEIMRWTFPASAEPVVVGSYPFTFDAALLRHHTAR